MVPHMRLCCSIPCDVVLKKLWNVLDSGNNAMEKDNVRVGVIGCGRAGLAHARGYLQNPAVGWVGVCDSNPERLRVHSAQLGVPGFPSVDQLLETGKPDLVSVVVPFNALVAPVRQCLDAGTSVLSEKPISFSA